MPSSIFLLWIKNSTHRHSIFGNSISVHFNVHVGLFPQADEFDLHVASEWPVDGAN